jgi:hypothetical protein
VRFEFESGTVSFCFPFTFFLFEESRLLVLWCAGGRCDMTCSNKDRGRSRRPGAEDLGMVAQVRYSVVGRSRGQVASCAVCTWHVETRSEGFLVEP